MKTWKLIELENIQPMWDYPDEYKNTLVKHITNHYFYCPCGKGSVTRLTPNKKGHQIVLKDPLTVAPSIIVTHYEQKKPCHFFINEGVTQWK